MNADQVAFMFNAQQTNTLECVTKMTRPTDDDFQTLFLACWPHLTFALNKHAYAGDTPEDKEAAKALLKAVVRFTYYSKTGEERDSLQQLVIVACEITGNSGNGKWFSNEYQTSPHSCWQYNASQLPGAYMGSTGLSKQFSWTAAELDTKLCFMRSFLEPYQHVASRHGSPFTYT